MSGTDTAYGAVTLCACYAISGTDIAFRIIPRTMLCYYQGEGLLRARVLPKYPPVPNAKSEVGEGGERGGEGEEGEGEGEGEGERVTVGPERVMEKTFKLVVLAEGPESGSANVPVVQSREFQVKFNAGTSTPPPPILTPGYAATHTNRYCSHHGCAQAATPVLTRAYAAT
eukprot:2405769-Rhodomonas_salina.3